MALTEQEVSNLTKSCTEVRKTIERLKSTTNTLQSFPYGCCKESSLILGQLLTTLGYRNILYCRKDIDELFASHVWLEYAGYIIDLTANQFGNNFPEILITDNLDSPYHISIEKRDFNFWSSCTDINFYHDYEIISKAI